MRLVLALLMAAFSALPAIAQQVQLSETQSQAAFTVNGRSFVIVASYPASKIMNDRGGQEDWLHLGLSTLVP